MAAQIKGGLTLSSGTIIRLVEQVPPGPPYTIEEKTGVDALGIARWETRVGFTQQDVIDILVAVAYLP